MATKVETPFDLAEVDMSDPTGSAISVVTGVLGVVLFGIIVTLGYSVYNTVAANTPDEIQEVEFL